MANISVSLPSDGSTADVADINTPINTIVNEINGNLDNSNISSSAAIDPSKLASSGFLGAWSSWTPTWTNLTVGNGAVAGRYVTIGKTVHFRLQITLGSTSTVGSDVSFTLPSTPIAGLNSGGRQALGGGALTDAGTAAYLAYLSFGTIEGTARVQYQQSSGTLGTLTSTTPFTWVTSDRISVQGTYEVA